MQQSLKVYKRSAIYLAGCLGLMAFSAFVNNSASKSHIFGDDSNFYIYCSDQGGKYLDVKTTHD